jgi:hypothetical protein
VVLQATDVLDGSTVGYVLSPEDVSTYLGVPPEKLRDLFDSKRADAAAKAAAALSMPVEASGVPAASMALFHSALNSLPRGVDQEVSLECVEAAAAGAGLSVGDVAACLAEMQAREQLLLMRGAVYFQ